MHLFAGTAAIAFFSSSVKAVSHSLIINAITAIMSGLSALASRFLDLYRFSESDGHHEVGDTKIHASEDWEHTLCCILFGHCPQKELSQPCARYGT
jgi:hypothetical protein